MEVCTVPVSPLRDPSYRLHKSSGRAVVTIDGRDIYLGKHDTAESRAEYHRLIAEWHTNGRRLPAPATDGSDLTVNELLVRYLEHADQYYRKHSQPTTDPGLIRLTIRPLRELYGHTWRLDSAQSSLKSSDNG
jgi:hypothetical protein